MVTSEWLQPTSLNNPHSVQVISLYPGCSTRPRNRRPQESNYQFNKAEQENTLTDLIAPALDPLHTKFRGLQNGTPVDGQHLGIRVFGEDKEIVQEADLKEIGDEIASGNIKYVFTNKKKLTSTAYDQKIK